MKNQIIITLSILLTAAVLFGISQRKKSIRFEQNWKAEVSDRADERQVTTRELKELYSVTAEMQRKLNIKPKQVTRWLQAPINYIDTGSVRLVLSPSDTVYIYPDSLHGEVVRPCYGLSWLIYKGNFTEQINYSDTVQLLMYRERPKRFLFIKYGRWVNSAALYSQCRDSVYKVFNNVRVIGK